MAVYYSIDYKLFVFNLFLSVIKLPEAACRVLIMFNVNLFKNITSGYLDLNVSPLSH